MAAKTERIICISPLFAPRADPEAYCGAKLILELVKRGIDVTVLSLDPTSPRSYACDDSDLWEPLKKITFNIATPADKDTVYSARMAIRYRTLSYARWISAVIEKAVVLHQRRPFDLVYSRSLPMEAHVAGYWISQRLNIPWLVNINDPWDWHLTPQEMRQEYPVYYGLMSTFWMRKTFNAASFITYPSSRLRDYHVRISGVQHRSEIIPHIGYAHEKKQEEKTFFRMVHAGRLGGWERRSPNALLKGLHLFLRKFPEARKSFRLILVGPEDKDSYAVAEELGIRSIVESTGRVNYQRSLEYIQSADVCVLVEGKLSEGIFLPSKLADYLASRKPVLALSPKVGVLSDMRVHQGIVRADTDDAHAVASALAVYYHAFKHDFLSVYAPSDELARQFAPDFVGDEFCRHVGRIVENKGIN